MSKPCRPNVLVLYSDQHNARCLGCYGNEQVQTPHLDKLAKEGLLFTRAYTQNPICTPSRMSFLSGQYPHNFGYYGLMGEKPARLPSLFSLFKNAGYRCGLAGKTHTPAEWLRPYCDALYDGFGYETAKDPSMYEQMEGVQGVLQNDYNDYLAEKGLLAERDDKIYHEWFALHRHSAGQGLDARPSRLDAEHTIEAWSAQCAIRFIRESLAANGADAAGVVDAADAEAAPRRAANDADKAAATTVAVATTAATSAAVAEKKQTDGTDRPFFFWMTVPRPHQTYVPAKQFWDLYDTDALNLPDNAEDQMAGRHPSAQKQQRYFKESQDWMSFEPKNYEAARRRVLHAYYANVSQVDDACGRVLDELDRQGLRENTIVLYLTDHGEFAGEHGMIEKAPGIAFHCVTRIPTLISWPGQLPAGESRHSLIESVDWFPTLAGLCGFDAPEHTDGLDLRPLLQTDQPLRRYAFTENAFTKTIHSERYKLTVYLPETTRGSDFGELYDLEADPAELHNLYFEPDCQAVVAELTRALCEWLMRSARPRTIGPSVCNALGQDGDWDLGGEFLAEDGSVKNSYIREMLETERFNYF